MRQICLVALMAALMVAIAVESEANGRSHGKGLQGRTDHRLKSSEDHGNETTGQLAVWLLIATNLTVAASVLIKGARKFLPLGEDAKKLLARFNQTQKKYMMRFHYLLNPAILTIALIHWSLSRCRSTFLPECGLICMVILASLGLVLKFKLAPWNSTRFLYKVHTHPVVLASIVIVLLTGHLMMD